MKHSHYTIMFFSMILSGLFSTMNVWVDKVDDIRFSLNDVYMTFLMTGWMFAFMGLFTKDLASIAFGTILVCVNIWCIRTQFMVSNTQYILGMIPHHSMAIHMSKQLIQNQPPELTELATNIIKAQDKEIKIMKRSLDKNGV